MNIHRIIIGISTLVYAYFILSFPISYYNDDSLFLANGIQNFSVIDFSPHFPGYVSLILIAKALNFFLEDIKSSLFYLSSFCAILTPLIIYLYVKKIQNKKIALLAFLLTISSPYLNNFALSLLSDSVGFFFLFLALYILEEKKYKVSGIIFAIAFFARPSYFIFFLIGIIYLFYCKKESLKSILVYFLLTSLVFFVYIYFTNSTLYFIEGKRFILGHFNIWGLGQNSSYTWFSNIFTLANLPFLLLFIFKYDKKLLLMYLFFVLYFLWIIFYQNPENLRHLIPIIFISNILMSKFLVNYKSVVSIILVFNIFIMLSFTQKHSPFSQITKLLDKENSIIVTNHSIELLREEDFIVIDKYYKKNTALVKEDKKLIIISTYEKDLFKARSFFGRFIGERTLFLSSESPLISK